MRVGERRIRKRPGTRRGSVNAEAGLSSARGFFDTRVVWVEPTPGKEVATRTALRHRRTRIVSVPALIRAGARSAGVAVADARACNTGSCEAGLRQTISGQPLLQR